ncbi:MAG: ATP-binding protein [Clostridiales bacterium]|nr:ATP-binding protein [Clostridiales bacterium]
MIDTREEQIRLLAKQLKIPTFANYMDVIRQSQPSADFSELLLDLLMAEATARQENQNRRRLKAAAFLFQKTLEEFDCSQPDPSVSPVFLQEMASCQFIQERKNIAMIGNPGRGKTHLSISIGLKACLQGYRVLFKNADSLSTELAEARDAYQLGRIECQLDKTDLLILDELSYMSLHCEKKTIRNSIPKLKRFTVGKRYSVMMLRQQITVRTRKQRKRPSGKSAQNGSKKQSASFTASGDELFRTKRVWI